MPDVIVARNYVRRLLHKDNAAQERRFKAQRKDLLSTFQRTKRDHALLYVGRFLTTQLLTLVLDALFGLKH